MYHVGDVACGRLGDTIIAVIGHDLRTSISVRVHAKHSGLLRDDVRAKASLCQICAIYVSAEVRVQWSQGLVEVHPEHGYHIRCRCSDDQGYQLGNVLGSLLLRVNLNFSEEIDMGRVWTGLHNIT